jgi:hypothetical protein
LKRLIFSGCQSLGRTDELKWTVLEGGPIQGSVILLIVRTDKTPGQAWSVVSSVYSVNDANWENKKVGPGKGIIPGYHSPRLAWILSAALGVARPASPSWQRGCHTSEKIVCARPATRHLQVGEWFPSAIGDHDHE